MRATRRPEEYGAVEQHAATENERQHADLQTRNAPESRRFCRAPRRRCHRLSYLLRPRRPAASCCASRTSRQAHLGVARPRAREQQRGLLRRELVAEALRPPRHRGVQLAPQLSHALLLRKLLRRARLAW